MPSSLLPDPSLQRPLNPAVSRHTDHLQGDSRMSQGSVSAVLFAKDHQFVAEFYRRVVDASVSDQDEYHTLLDVQGFRLVIHQIPEGMSQEITIATPPQRREQGALRLDFTIPNIIERRAMARLLGGQIDDLPPPWAGADTSFFLGFDPEGNVVGFNVS